MGYPRRCTKRLPPLPGSLGRSGHNSAAPCAQPALKPLQWPCPGRRPVGRSGCTPKLAFLNAGRLGPWLQDLGDGTRQWEKRRQPVKPSQSSSSCCYSLTNMAAADAAAACSGRAPSRSRGSTSWPSRLHSSIFSSKQSLLREGSRPHTPQLASCGKAEAEVRAGGRRGTGRAGRKFAAAGPARPEPGW